MRERRDGRCQLRYPPAAAVLAHATSSGCGGIWLQDGDATSLARPILYIEDRSPRRKRERFEARQEEFENPLWRRYLRDGAVGVHRGSGYLHVRADADCMREGLPTVIDAFDTAT